MNHEVTILIAEDDAGHAGLIQKNLLRSGLKNKIVHFKDGQETLDFLLGTGDERRRDPGSAYLLLLDIRMPRVDGVEVLARLKSEEKLRKMPVIMITTTDDPREVANCHRLGCSNYITKPIDYDNFVDAIRKLGLFLTVVQVPEIDGEADG